MALLLYTGQRRADVIKMGRQLVRDGVLHVKQQKTGAQLFIPVHAHLQEIIDATVVGQLNFQQVGQAVERGGLYQLVR